MMTMFVVVREGVDDDATVKTEVADCYSRSGHDRDSRCSD